MVLLLHVSIPRMHEQREHISLLIACSSTRARDSALHSYLVHTQAICSTSRCRSHDCSGILAEVHAHVQIILQDMWKGREKLSISAQATHSLKAQFVNARSSRSLPGPPSYIHPVVVSKRRPVPSIPSGGSRQ